MKLTIRTLLIGICFCLKGYSTDAQEICETGLNLGISEHVHEFLELDNQDVTIKSSQFQLNVDFGEINTLGSAEFPEDAVLDFSIQYMDIDDNVIPGTETTEISFTINQNQPEQIYYRDMTEFFTSYAEEAVKVVVSLDGFFGPNGTDSPALFALIENNIRFCTRVINDYGIDVEPMPHLFTYGTSFSILPFTSRNNTLILERPGWRAPMYQIQVLKIYNQNPMMTEDSRLISGTIDWSDALTLEHEVDFSLGDTGREFIDFPPFIEGTGYYVWRVRPVGSVFPGGANNPKNLIPWENYDSDPYGFQNGSLSSFNTYLDGDDVYLDFGGGSVNLDNTLPNFFQVLYFQDPDHDMNWSYYRAFADDISLNTMTYADPLLRAMQAQVVSPADDQLIVNSSVTDLSGRSSISFMPVPMDNDDGIESYIPGLVISDETGEDYSFKDFDFVSGDQNKYESPSLVEDENSPYSYYNGETNMVASAQGIPYSRVVFEPDGSGRIKEVSGPGETFALDHVDAYGKHTSRTLYGNATEAELIALFGKEAPLSKHVKKTISIDPNNVMSVSYSSAEGHLIASGLVKSNPDAEYQTDLVEIDETNSIEGKTSDVFEGNISLKNGLFSSKRYVNTIHNNEIDLSYGIFCKTLQNGCVDGSCNYRLKLELIHIENPENNITYYALINSSDETNCTPMGEEFITPVTHYYSDPELTSSIEDVDGVLTVSDLPIGTFIIQKTLELSDAFGAPIENLQDLAVAAGTKVQEEIEGYQSMITDWMLNDGPFQTMNNLVNYQLLGYQHGLHCQYFYSDDECTGGTTVGPELVSLDYSFLPHNSGITNWSQVLGFEDLMSFDLHLTSECCGDLTINLLEAEDEPVCIDPWTDGTNYEIKDLWCELLAAIEDSEIEENSTTVINDAMAPYNAQVLEGLVHNMLTYEYEIVVGEGAQIHYNVEEIEECWESTMQYIVTAYGGSASLDNPFDVADDDAAGEGGDNIIDNMPGWLAFLMFGFNADDEDVLGDVQDEDFSLGDENLPIHPMVFFFQCIGHKFTVEPYSNDPNGLYDHDGSILGYGPIEYLDFAHCYFDYSDGDCEICEQNTCYHGDDGCSSSCSGQLPYDDATDPWDYNDWFTLYECIKTGCPEIPETAQSITCEDMVTDELKLQLFYTILNQVSSCENEADNKSILLRESLEFEFVESGWNVVECITPESNFNDVPQSDFELMADDIVISIKEQCKVQDNDFSELFLLVNEVPIEELVFEDVGIDVGNNGTIDFTIPLPVIDGFDMSQINPIVESYFDFIDEGCDITYCQIKVGDLCKAAEFARVLNWELTLDVPEADIDNELIIDPACNNETDCLDDLESADYGVFTEIEE